MRFEIYTEKRYCIDRLYTELASLRPEWHRTVNFTRAVYRIGNCFLKHFYARPNWIIYQTNMYRTGKFASSVYTELEVPMLLCTKLESRP